MNPFNVFRRAERELAERQLEIASEVRERFRNPSTHSQALCEVYTKLFEHMPGVDAGELIEFISSQMTELEMVMGLPSEWHRSALDQRSEFGPFLNEETILRGFALSIAGAVMQFWATRTTRALGYLEVEMVRRDDLGFEGALPDSPVWLEVWNEALETV